MSATPDGPSHTATPASADTYWRKNLQYLAVLLTIWFIVSFGCGILFADYLDQFRVAGFPLGFWFAQQGSIYAFVALVFVYVWLMNRLDREYAGGNASEEKDSNSRGELL